MKKYAVIAAALILGGCAHQGSSARYQNGSSSSLEAERERSYSRSIWGNISDTMSASGYETPSATDYLSASIADPIYVDVPTRAEQMDPAARINVRTTTTTAVATPDVDASVEAITDPEAAAAAAVNQDLLVDPADTRAINVVIDEDETETTAAGTASAAESGSAQTDDIGSNRLPDGELANSSKELPGARARQEDIPAAFAPLKDNHPDLTDDPDYERSAPNAGGIGGSATNESGSNSGAASSVESGSESSSVRSVEVQRGGVDDRLEVNSAPIGSGVKSNESDLSVPLGGGTPSDGSSSELNSGSSIDRSAPGAISVQEQREISEAISESAPAQQQRSGSSQPAPESTGK